VPSTGILDQADDGIVEDEPPPREAAPSTMGLRPADAGPGPDPASADSPPSPSQPPGAGGKKPKREIPPYLRRIK
jgi:hypothetical protein